MKALQVTFKILEDGGKVILHPRISLSRYVGSFVYPKLGKGRGVHLGYHNSWKRRKWNGGLKNNLEKRKKREDGALKEFGQGMGGCGRLSRASGKALKAKQPSRWEMGKW
ncbi:hypothetical protein CK203_048465 [Vitis vinifera]|uniref:Uncharacterized protein n=1 Tax=Vitis vinifera TaxID=29760 RepID=A0A438H2C5_VITVI|nr:hypothetical protein CK203_048465 [Vitis vinifera]